MSIATPPLPAPTIGEPADVSVETFLSIPEDGIHRELIRGRVREMGMTVRNRVHSRIEANATFFLVGWLRSQPAPRGEVVCGEAGFRLKGTKDSLVGIDVALVSAELVAATPAKQAIFDGPPVLAVEILSPSDVHENIVEMVAAFLEVGTTTWVVDPDFRTVTIHRPGQPPRSFNVDETINDEPALPGFQVRVADLFA
jgi:Uma2 family endonuclease